MPNGFSHLREKQRFIPIKGTKDVKLGFGKYKDLTFKDVSKVDPEYLQFLLDTQEENLTRNVRLRLHYWLDRSLPFWV